MTRKTLLVLAPLGLGAGILLVAAMSARGAQEPKPARPAPKAPAARKAPAGDVSASTEISAAVPRTAAAPAAAPSAGGEFSVIEDRIRKMEEKLLALEVKRDSLAGANQEMERQIVERNAELSARQQAEWRVRAWEQLLGLSGDQKQALTEMWARWLKQDAGRPQDRETWLSRETDLRSRLTVEQAAKLHDTATQQSEMMWKNLGRTIGGMVGASKDDQTRFQQTLGDYRAPNAMLLPEGYGADWPGQLKEATTRLQPVLSSDQMAKLGRFVQK